MLRLGKESRGGRKCDPRRALAGPVRERKKILIQSRLGLSEGRIVTASAGISGPPMVSFGRCLAALAAASVLLAANTAARAQALSDRKPNGGVASAHAMPVQGIDVSYWQGDIDWAKAREAGVRFTFIKATEGGDHLDSKFHENWAGARDAGIARGAYHFLYWCRPADEQALWFMLNVPPDPDALPPVQQH